MNPKEEVRMTHSSVLSKDGDPYVSVRFERGNDVAEGSVPACRITKNEGFSAEEVLGLEGYLEQNAREILRRAKDISGLRHWFGIGKKT